MRIRPRPGLPPHRPGSVSACGLSPLCAMASVQHDQQRLDLAEFGGPLMADPIDAASSSRSRISSGRPANAAHRIRNARRSRDPSAPDNARHHRRAHPPRHWPAPAATPAAPASRIAALFGASSGSSARSRGRVKAISRLVGSSAKAIFALFSVAIKLRFRHIQQRARQQDAVALALAGHRRQTRDAAAAKQPHQQRLGLVIPCVGGQHVGGAARPRRLRQQTIARIARRGRQARPRLGAASSAACDAQSSLRASRLTSRASRAASLRKP